MDWEKQFDKKFTGILADRRVHFISPDMDGAELKQFIQALLAKQKKEIKEMIEKKIKGFSKKVSIKFDKNKEVDPVETMEMGLWIGKLEMLKDILKELNK